MAEASPGDAFWKLFLRHKIVLDHPLYARTAVPKNLNNYGRTFNPSGWKSGNFGEKQA